MNVLRDRQLEVSPGDTVGRVLSATDANYSCMVSFRGNTIRCISAGKNNLAVGDVVSIMDIAGDSWAVKYSAGYPTRFARSLSDWSPSHKAALALQYFVKDCKKDYTYNLGIAVSVVSTNVLRVACWDGLVRDLAVEYAGILAPASRFANGDSVVLYQKYPANWVVVGGLSTKIIVSQIKGAFTSLALPSSSVFLTNIFSTISAADPADEKVVFAIDPGVGVLEYSMVRTGMAATFLDAIEIPYTSWINVNPLMADRTLAVTAGRIDNGSLVPFPAGFKTLVDGGLKWLAIDPSWLVPADPAVLVLGGFGAVFSTGPGLVKGGGGVFTVDEFGNYNDQNLNIGAQSGLPPDFLDVTILPQIWSRTISSWPGADLSVTRSDSPGFHFFAKYGF